MSRLIFTFENLFQVLSADRLLRATVQCRPTPTPSGLATAICGISLELLEAGQKESAVALLASSGLAPRGVHEVN